MKGQSRLIRDRRALGRMLAPLWLVGCSSRTEVDVLEVALHNGAGEPVITLIAAEVCVTDHDRGPSTSYEAIALRSFRGAELAPSPSVIELEPRHGSPFEKPILVPLLRATADTVNAQDGARGPLVMFTNVNQSDSVVVERVLWDFRLGSAPAPEDAEEVMTSADSSIFRVSPRPSFGSSMISDSLVGWSPDVGPRFTFAFPPLANPPTSCPEGYTGPSAGAGGRMKMSPGGRFIAYTSRGGVACSLPGTTAWQSLLEWFDAVVIDAGTGAPIAPHVRVEAPRLRFSQQPCAAVADDGVMIVLLPGDEAAGTDDRWSVRGADGSELYVFAPEPDTEVIEVFAWDGGWLFETRTDLVSVTREGGFRSSAALPVENAQVVVAGDGIYTLGGYEGESSEDVFYSAVYCVDHRDAALQILESHCLDQGALMASFVDD